MQLVFLHDAIGHHPVELRSMNNVHQVWELKLTAGGGGACLRVDSAGSIPDGLAGGGEVRGRASPARGGNSQRILDEFYP